MKIVPMRVDYVDHMGSDLSVVNAARVSFDKESEWDHHDYAHPVLSERDNKLIAYLASHNHWSPFAHTAVQLRVKAPIFVARQLVKHQVGGVWNEVSRRYVDSEPEFWFPDQWRGRPEGSMKQGSSGVVERVRMHDDNGNGVEYPISNVTKQLVSDAFNVYKDLIDGGVAPEQARMILPQNMMTEWYWTGSLMFWARVCKQRLDPHAQQETREVAVGVSQICQGLFPRSWIALMA